MAFLPILKSTLRNEKNNKKIIIGKYVLRKLLAVI